MQHLHIIFCGFPNFPAKRRSFNDVKFYLIEEMTRQYTGREYKSLNVQNIKNELFI